MEAPAHSPAAQALPHMARTPESPPAPAATPDAGETVAADAPAAAAGRTRIRDQVAENPLMALFGTVFVALLMFNFTTTHSRISDTNDRITRLEERITRFEESVDAKFEAQDARFEALDAKIDEINLKLTAIIAALNATAEVDAALEGRLLDPDEPDAAD